MANLYQGDLVPVKMARKTTVTSRYRSDQRKALFGGRGGRDQEINYLFTQAGTTGTQLSSAWQAFGSKRGISGSRANTTKRKFFEESTFP